MDFIKENYQMIIALIGALVSVICVVIRKKPCSNLFDSIMSAVIINLPKMINAVECEGEGRVKKTAVLDASIDCFEHMIHRKLDTDELAVVSETLDKSIEAILSTPQKKSKED